MFSRVAVLSCFLLLLFLLSPYPKPLRRDAQQVGAIVLARRIVACQRACVRTPWCHAIVVKLADDHGGPRQLEACWMREVVEPGECVHGSDYELFTVNGSDHERPPPLLSQL